MAKIEHIIDVDAIEIDLRLQQPWYLHMLKLEAIIVSEVANVSVWMVLTIGQVQTKAYFFSFFFFK